MISESPLGEDNDEDNAKGSTLMRAQVINSLRKLVTIKETGNTLLAWIFPRRCPICMDIVPVREGLIHGECYKKLIYVKEPACMRCGKPLQNIQQEYCFDCRCRPVSFDGGRSVWEYTRQMSQSIAGFKYHGMQEFAEFYAREAVRLHRDWILSRHIECLIPVPLNSRRLRKRGYNQAYVVAKRIGRQLGLPVDSSQLHRRRFTRPQKNLTPDERLKNLEKAFTAGKKIGRYRCVLLIDDIYTTGSTMKACSKILKASGIQTVYVLSLCIGQGV